MTEEELFEMMEKGGGPQQGQALVRGWLDRGDGVAAYENKALDSGQLGHVKYLSFGSERAQLEPKDCDSEGNPPQRLPDIGPALNWAYQLVGTVWRDR